MQSKRITMLLLFMMIALGTVIFMDYAKYSDFLNQRYKISKIQVLQGHEFDIVLDNQQRIKGQLKIKTPSKATKKVIQLINSSSKPEVVLIKKRDHTWDVEVYLVKDKKRFALTDWLRSNQLVWD